MVQRGWTLNQATWRAARERLGQAVWVRRPLAAEVRRNVPIAEGVYVICGHATVDADAGGLLAALYNAVYVGKATNLRSRFDDHCRGYGDVRFARLVFRKLDFWFSETQDLEDLEQLLMDTFGPPANRVNAIEARIGEPQNARRSRGR